MPCRRIFQNWLHPLESDWQSLGKLSEAAKLGPPNDWEAEDLPDPFGGRIVGFTGDGLAGDGPGRIRLCERRSRSF
jgi:hypothetical protein